LYQTIKLISLNQNFFCVIGQSVIQIDWRSGISWIDSKHLLHLPLNEFLRGHAAHRSGDYVLDVLVLPLGWLVGVVRRLQRHREVWRRFSKLLFGLCHSDDIDGRRAG